MQLSAILSCHAYTKHACTEAWRQGLQMIASRKELAGHCLPACFLAYLLHTGKTMLVACFT